MIRSLRSKRGQALIETVAVLPLIAICAACLVDVGAAFAQELQLIDASERAAIAALTSADVAGAARHGASASLARELHVATHGNTLALRARAHMPVAIPGFTPTLSTTITIPQPKALA